MIDQVELLEQATGNHLDGRAEAVREARVHEGFLEGRVRFQRQHEHGLVLQVVKLHGGAPRERQPLRHADQRPARERSQLARLHPGGQQRVLMRPEQLDERQVAGALGDGFRRHQARWRAGVLELDGRVRVRHAA